MADLGHASASSNQPPPAPPLPPGRAGGVFQKFIAPLSFNIGARPHGAQANQSTSVSPSTISANRGLRQLTSQTTTYRTRIPIAAIDANKPRTHAILAGPEILRTIHVRNGKAVEDFNLRSNITSYASVHGVRSENANHRREYLPAKDVCWSPVDKYSNIIATAALNGRIALYDVSRLSSSKVELAWIHEHTGQVNKLDFDQTGGYLLLSGSQDKTVRIWDIREPQSVKRRQNINIRHPVREVRWSPTDPGEFALCTENGMVQRWDLRNPSTALLSINAAHERACYTIDWHPDGRHLVSGGFDKYIKVWNLKSENKRQKPLFQPIRTPEAILSVRWRPPSWSGNLAESGSWHTAQLATSYTVDDPRIHIWDLRRPWIPFREIDRYNSQPSDIMWAAEDLLWSVSEQGVFTQTDVQDTQLVHEELSTSATSFMPDGSFLSFSEDRRTRRPSITDDAAADFLCIPQERLSGGTDGIVSRSLSEDEADDGMLSVSSKRRLSKSSRSAKSQGNTPPTGDGFPNLMSLDKAVLNRNGLFVNEQTGLASRVAGVAPEPEVVSFLASNYARPMTIEERKRDPSKILKRLQEAFSRNAYACDCVSLHRMAQSWRILSAVVVPELQEWADANRKQRLEFESRQKTSVPPSRANKSAPLVPTLPKMSVRSPDIKITTKSEKVMNNLFKGVTESERTALESESTSNMTTPLAKPLSDPAKMMDHQEHAYMSLNETIEPITPLPPSVVSAHSTAAAASNALMSEAEDESPPSSPERVRRPAAAVSQHKRSVTDTQINTIDLRSIQPQSPKTHPASRPISSTIMQPSPRIDSRRQEDRRAAIRDFRVQQRQPFTFDDPVRSPRYSAAGRHDSSESFPMFSLSTEGSNRTRSLGLSFNSASDRSNRPHDSDEWQSVRNEDASDSSPPSSSSDPQLRQEDRVQRQDFETGSIQETFPMDEPTKTDLANDSKARPTQTTNQPKPSASASMWGMEELKVLDDVTPSSTAASSASGSGVFHFEQAHIAPKLKIYSSNPIRRISKAQPSNAQQLEAQRIEELDEDVSSKGYVLSDFRTIDFTTYEPRLPFAWSALPLICHSIEFDMLEGIACGQFSVHLLMHLHPFFFDPALRAKIQSGVAQPEGVAEKLMRPDLSYRIIENLFLNHFNYLKKMEMYIEMAELKNVCIEFDYPEIHQQGQQKQSTGASLIQDAFQLQTSCRHCLNIMPSNATTCPTCRASRDGCPICLQISNPQPSNNTYKDVDGQPAGDVHLWTYCQTCGHSSHWQCMQEWMLQAGVGGECPSRGCGCDCGPGILRQQRIIRRLKEAENAEIIRGSRNSSATKKDPMRASPSPAVDKTRDNLLRSSDFSGSRENSGDERLRRSMSARSMGSGVSSSTGGNRRAVGNSPGPAAGLSTSGGGGFSHSSRGALSSQSFGRRVRLVTPGEEAEPS